MDKIIMLADIIEPVLSGRYGRGVAEEIAEECLRVLSIEKPVKWELGNWIESRREVCWGRGYVYAKDEKEAAGIFSQRERRTDLQRVREFPCGEQKTLDNNPGKV